MTLHQDEAIPPPLTLRGPKQGFLFGCLFSMAIIANTMPYFIGDSYADSQKVSDAATRWQYVALAALLSASLLCFLRGRSSVRLDATSAWAIGPISIYLMFNALFSDIPSLSATYAALFLIVAIAIISIRLPPEEWLRAFRTASLLSAAVMLSFVLAKSTNGRYYGAVHPNFVGGWIFVQAVLIYLWPASYRWVGMAALAVLTVTVDSRYCGVALIIFVMVTELLSRLRSPRRLVLFLFLGTIISSVAGGYVVSFIVGEGNRSLSGGVAGRFARWDITFQHIIERPLLGYGFRTLHEGIFAAHSGATSMIAELGILGALVLLPLAVGRLRGLYHHITRPESAASQKLAIMMLGSLVAYLSPLIFQPNYLNFGDPIGILILLCLFVQLPSRPTHYPSS